MRKIILALFIILFCFSIGIAGLQEEELSKEEIKIIKKQKEKEVIISFLAQELEKLIETVEIPDEGDPKLYYGEVANICEEIVKTFEKIAILSREIVTLEKERESLGKQLEGKKDFLEPNRLTDDYEHRFSWLDKYPDLTKKEQKKELSWEEKYRIYPSTKYWLDSLKEPDERYLKRIEEENDRLEDLLDEISSERFNLEQDMMMHRWEIEDAKPKPWDYRMAAEQAIEDAMFDMMMWPDLVLGPLFTRFYYPGYSKKKERTNYEPLLFTLCTDSKGKMDWTKYGWLKIWLRNK